MQMSLFLNPIRERVRKLVGTGLHMGDNVRSNSIEFARDPVKRVVFGAFHVDVMWNPQLVIAWVAHMVGEAKLEAGHPVRTR